MSHSVKSPRTKLPFGRIVVPVAVLATAVGVAFRYGGAGSDNTVTCRVIPGDSTWPEADVWAELSSTLNGKLIANVPIAAPCHDSLFGQANALFNQDECDTLRDNWFLPETHLVSPSSPMGYDHSGNSCNPFLAPTTPCTIGAHAVYTINATETVDFQLAIRFATEHNIRLVIRNTGHDYLGKSTGAHSLAVWTHNFKAMNSITYTSDAYTGPALKLGAGVEVLEAYRYASSQGLVVVGGNCPTVALGGGFAQGGGHGPFASRYGLSSDQVLEWEVVTGTGELLIASATQNSDLFWALRGGGGGTFGIVSSVTVKAFPETSTSTAYLTILNDGTNEDSLYSALVPFMRDTLPSLVDAGAFVVWVAAPFGFMIVPAIAPGVSLVTLDSLLKPMRQGLDAMGLTYTYNSAEHPTFLATYEEQIKTQTWNVSSHLVGGRLIPRDLATQRPEELVNAVRYIASQTLVSGVSYKLTGDNISPEDSSVNPYIRSTLFSLAVGAAMDYTDWPTTKVNQDKLTYDHLASLEKLTPNGAAYLNEADVQQPDFQRTIYGTNYGKLRDIKNKYDPLQLFYARTAVGSDEWAEDSSGRLCKVLA